MGDTRSTCNLCNSPHIGFIADVYSEELKKRIISTGIPDEKTINLRLTSAEVNFKNDEIRKLMDDLGVRTDCCRISLMSFADANIT